jgi:hypothetical protein
MSRVGKKNPNFRHGGVGTPEYRAYTHAKSRCTNPSDAAYSDYGGRGIEFQFRSFEEFFSTVGPRPSPRHKLDRRNNQDHYRPGNVRWLSPQESVQNRRGVLHPEQVLEIYSRIANGARVRDVAKDFGVGRRTVYAIKSGESWANLTGGSNGHS